MLGVDASTYDVLSYQPLSPLERLVIGQSHASAMYTSALNSALLFSRTRDLRYEFCRNLRSETSSDRYRVVDLKHDNAESVLTFSAYAFGFFYGKNGVFQLDGTTLRQFSSSETAALCDPETALIRKDSSLYYENLRTGMQTKCQFRGLLS